MPKVCIVKGNPSYDRMFQDRGWEIVGEEDADLIQFTGGADVSPALYGQQNKGLSHTDLYRDLQDIQAYVHALDRGVPMAGICRGGQFLHVMNGGKMVQHIEGHGIAGLHHVEIDTKEGFAKANFKVSSTHHQAMSWDTNVTPDLLGLSAGGEDFCEAVLYRKTKCYCFQPHPELNIEGIEGCRDYYFEKLDMLLAL